MVLQKGSTGESVKAVQNFLKIPADGVFGAGTEAAVKKWQSENNLSPDGIVGTETWNKMGIGTTDMAENKLSTPEGLIIQTRYLPKGEYLEGPTKKEFLFLHHTAGWDNPYDTIDQWARDTRGAIATEFVIGGPSVKGNSVKYDGEVVQAFPAGAYGWHLGENGSQYMHTHSVGIEVCNFGWLKNGVTYAGTTAAQNQVVKLPQPFRGYDTWHRYSEKQIDSLKKLIQYIANRDNIDVRAGLVSEIKARGAIKAFEYNDNAYYGKVKGMWTHTNTRKDKFDMFPQPELVEMLLSL